jgi:CDP-6-deoxy-D-xylo-4-hexulose-3-dehydrase
MGLTPVVVDVHDTLNIDIGKMIDSIAAVGGVQGCVIPHTLGNPVDPQVWEFFYKSVEDCCDALGSEINGAKCGTFGTVSCFSFYPAHHITTGEGGMAVSMSHSVGEIIRKFVNWGRDCWCRPGFDNSCGKRFESMVDGIPWDHKYEFVIPGGNFKPSFDAQGVLGLVQLRKEELYRAKRKRNWKIINDTLRPLEDAVGTAGKLPGSDPSWFGYALEVKRGDRKRVIADLESAGVASRLVFGGNMGRQRFLRDKFVAPFPLATADDIMRNWLVVGCNHTITEEEAQYIADTVKWAVTK